MRIALISCSKNKMTVDCAAREMYSKSTLFNKTFTYCLARKYDFIFIISAKHGILDPGKIISPYELTLKSLSNDCIRKWASECFKTLASRGLEKGIFDFYSGKTYFQELSKLLPNSTNVLKGLGIGQRLNFLSQ